MRENYTPKIIMIILVLLTSLYVALPSLGVFLMLSIMIATG